MKSSGIFLAFFVLVVVAETSSAEIYRWVDENGVVHFSDSPTESISDANREDAVSSPGPQPDVSTPPATEGPQITLDPNFFDILDESKENTAAVQAPSVEIYETSW